VLNRTASENGGVMLSAIAVRAIIWVIDDSGHSITMSDILSPYMYLHIPATAMALFTAGIHHT
jgi:hypothetical protein